MSCVGDLLVCHSSALIHFITYHGITFVTGVSVMDINVTLVVVIVICNLFSFLL